MKWESDKESTFIAIGLVESKHSSLGPTRVDSICVSIYSKEEEHLSFDLELSHYTTRVTVISLIHPNIDHVTVGLI